MSENNREAVVKFLKSYDFMFLSQAIIHKNFNSAMMNVQRMQKEAEDAGLGEFARMFGGIRQCLIRYDYNAAIDVMSLVTSRRVQMLKQYGEV